MSSNPKTGASLHKKCTRNLNISEDKFISRLFAIIPSNIKENICTFDIIKLEHYLDNNVTRILTNIIFNKESIKINVVITFEFTFFAERLNLLFIIKMFFHSTLRSEIVKIEYILSFKN